MGAGTDLGGAAGLVDLHCHVLPGIDDGAATMDDSLAMAAQADADGITLICATPHIRPDHRVVTSGLAGRVSTLNGALAAAGRTVRVVTGGEVAAPIAASLSDEVLREVSLGGTGRWILVEPRPGPMDDALDAAVRALAARGLRCVIAHPERHAGADAAERLTGLVGAGALVQVTPAFLVEHPAAPTILDWAARGLVHVLGSDAHSATAGRPVAVSAGLRALAAVPHLAPHVGWIGSTGPRAILAGESVSPPF